MDYSARDDDSLIRDIVAGRPEALGALYDRYSRLVYSLAFRTVGDPGTAEEVTQDVFVSVWDRAASYRAEQAKVSTWLTSIARYRAIDALRRRGVRPEGHRLDWEAASPADLPRVEGPERAVEQYLESQRVRAAVATLPAEQREALSLAYFEGLTHSEIAATLGQPLGTVKTRIRLAMLKLRDLLAEQKLPAR